MAKRILCIVALGVLAAGCSSDPEVMSEGPAPDAGVTEAPAPADPPDDDEEIPADDPPPEDDGLGLACDLDEISPILSCAFENCLELPGLDPSADPSDFDPSNLGFDFDLAEIGTCVATSCFGELLGLSPECGECIFGLIGGGDGALEGCLGGDGLPEIPELP